MKLPDILSFPDVKLRIRDALAEDLGPGQLDVTSFALVPEGKTAVAHLVARQAGVLSGGPVAAEVFRQTDAFLEVDQRKLSPAMWSWSFPVPPAPCWWLSARRSISFSA